MVHRCDNSIYGVTPWELGSECEQRWHYSTWRSFCDEIGSMQGLSQLSAPKTRSNSICGVGLWTSLENFVFLLASWCGEYSLHPLSTATNALADVKPFKLHDVTTLIDSCNNCRFLHRASVTQTDRFIIAIDDKLLCSQWTLQYTTNTSLADVCVLRST
jgi:hypothetical protein